MRRLRVTVALASALAALVIVGPAPSAHAEIVPRRSGTERVLYRPGGKVTGATAVANTAAGLSKVKSAPRGLAFLGSPGGRGLLRVRLESHKKRVDATVILGGRFPEGEPDKVSGWGIRLRNRRVQVVRVKDGKVRATLHGTRAKLKRGGAVEVIAWSVGGTIDVQAFTVGSGKHLGSVSVKGRPSFGKVGVLFGKRHHPKAVITRVSVRRNCASAGAQPAGLGPTRYVHVKASSVAAAAATGRAERLEVVRKPSPGTIFKTDALGLEKLACAGIDATVSLETPWKYIDASYRKYRLSPPKSTATGFVVDRAYKNPRAVGRLLKAYAKRFPQQTTLYRIGRSHGRRSIYAMAITADITTTDGKPSVLLNAAHHGNEPMSTEFVFDAVQMLLERQSDPRVQRWLRELVIWVVPQVNPDGAYAFLETSNRTGRKNGRDLDRNGKRDLFDGVDLNRNYPFRWGAHGEKGSKSNKKSVWYRGTKPASEPETKAMMALFGSEFFSASLSYHVGSVAVLAPYTIPGVINPTPNAPWVIAEALVAGLPPHPQDRTYDVRKNLYDVDGTDQDWFRAAYGTTALLVEGARTSPVKPAERRAIVAHGRPLWQRLVDRYIDGPTIEVVVKDPKGHPVQARVDLLGLPNHNGEEWTTRCRDGFYGHMLAAPGDHLVAITAPGLPPMVKPVTVDKRVRVTFTLPAAAVDPTPCAPIPGNRLAKPNEIGN